MLLFMFILARTFFVHLFCFGLLFNTSCARTLATDIVGIIYLIVGEKEREEQAVAAAISIWIGFDNGWVEYGTTVVPTTLLPTITTDNGFEKRAREYGFGFCTIPVVVAVT